MEHTLPKDPQSNLITDRAAIFNMAWKQHDISYRRKACPTRREQRHKCNQICQYNIETFIGPIRQKPVQYDIFRIGPIPVSPITTRSESSRHFANCKKKSREILDWLINKGIIT
jgi:hypothetical protein